MFWVYLEFFFSSLFSVSLCTIDACNVVGAQPKERSLFRDPWLQANVAGRPRKNERSVPFFMILKERKKKWTWKGRKKEKSEVYIPQQSVYIELLSHVTTTHLKTAKGRHPNGPAPFSFRLTKTTLPFLFFFYSFQVVHY